MIRPSFFSVRKSEQDYKTRSYSEKNLFNLPLLHKNQINGFVKGAN